MGSLMRREQELIATELSTASRMSDHPGERKVRRKCVSAFAQDRRFDFKESTIASTVRVVEKGDNKEPDKTQP